ncbi:sugar ABC transporter substrate-binding protein [Paenibacillus sp. sptzw28]|uniref:sugar ABC transporter substrate-binding protein n=1 Tax=Paenibacillus sp. sptzw28 TaxID=715179 RepID=UPI001C6F0005|nr:sugar ABC transporter substrate-binding protein [Paenibacillus sp. sptzw28]QYR19915.1 sugar ABC transporter substrate-binding protein [Paenibacillus sp. sptzw28]
MKSWGKSSVILLLAALLLVISACGQQKTGSGGTEQNNPAGSASQTNPQDGQASLKGKRIALIMQFNTGTFSSQYIEGVKDQAGKLGGEVQVFASDGDLAKMASNLDAAVNQGFDGILIDHGQAGALDAGVKKAVEQKIPVVVFDADIKVPGVTVLQQDDQKMAEMTLEQLAKDAGGKGTIVKVWVAGFAPMERRQIAYKAFLDKYPDIKEIAAFGNATNPALDTQTQMEAILRKYPNKGDITAVWASWDEFAKGATRAIQQAGRTEIKVYGIDMSDEDLQMIQDPASPWVASAAVDPKSIGRVQVRYLYQKFHGDKTEDIVVLSPSFVKREDLPKPPEKVNTAQLDKYVKGWGSSEQGNTEWLKQLEGSK